jgi:hypothetical protein
MPNARCSGAGASSTAESGLEQVVDTALPQCPEFPGGAPGGGQRADAQHLLPGVEKLGPQLDGLSVELRQPAGFTGFDRRG